MWIYYECDVRKLAPVCPQQYTLILPFGGGALLARAAPSMGSNFFVFTYVFAKICPRRRSAPPPPRNGSMPPPPPTGNSGSATECPWKYKSILSIGAKYCNYIGSQPVFTV